MPDEYYLQLVRIGLFKAQKTAAAADDAVAKK